jgi:5-methylcytosine-specific restriction endonuclease McrA
VREVRWFVRSDAPDTAQQSAAFRSWRLRWAHASLTARSHIHVVRERVLTGALVVVSRRPAVSTIGSQKRRIRLSQVIERDGLACWICKKPVDPASPRQAPEGATLDHVLPQMNGGRHELANLRLSHKRCNEARGHACALLKDGHLLLDPEALRTIAAELHRCCDPAIFNQEDK